MFSKFGWRGSLTLPDQNVFTQLHKTINAILPPIIDYCLAFSPFIKFIFVIQRDAEIFFTCTIIFHRYKNKTRCHKIWLKSFFFFKNLSYWKVIFFRSIFNPNKYQQQFCFCFKQFMFLKNNQIRMPGRFACKSNAETIKTFIFRKVEYKEIM